MPSTIPVTVSTLMNKTVKLHATVVKTILNNFLIQ